MSTARKITLHMDNGDKHTISHSGGEDEYIQLYKEDWVTVVRGKITQVEPSPLDMSNAMAHKVYSISHRVTVPANKVDKIVEEFAD